MVRSTNLNDFLGKHSVPALVQDALAKSKIDQEMQVSGEEQISKEAAAAVDESLIALSKQTGLSLETLRMIKKVEDKVTEKKEATQKSVNEQADKQRHQTLTNLASQIRYLYQMRNTSTLQMAVLLEQLNGRQ